MHAHKLADDNESENDVAEDAGRESQTRLITRRIPSAPWERQRTTFLEQALAESILVDGGLCVIQEIDANAAVEPEGSFDVVEISVGPDGRLLEKNRARFAALVRNIPALKPRHRRSA